jgi:eukaryotic-like serine/threonine-protein kinase
MRCLARDPADRFPDARALASAVSAYLDGPRDALFLDDVEPLIQMGTAAMARRDGLLEDYAIESDALATALAELDPEDPAEAKQGAWQAEARLEALEIEIADAFGRAVSAFTRAASVAPDHPTARQTLCELYLGRAEAAAFRGEHARAAFYRRLIAEHDDGSHAGLLAREGTVHVELQPKGAQVTLRRFEERERVMVATDPIPIGPSPARSQPLPEGTYQLTGEAPEFEALTTTVVVQGGKCSRLRLRLLRAGGTPPGYAHIPAGTFLFGSTRSRFSTPSEQALPDYLIGCTTVSVAAYLEFVQDLAVSDPQQAARRVPRAGPAWRAAERGTYRLPEGLAPERTPVVGISAEDALAYCRWISEIDGVGVRLPSEEEWEKAARATEGRDYPWGRRWEASFAHTAHTWNEPHPPESGTAPRDRSVFGVLDLAGGVREWTASRAPGRSPRMIVRGGSFLTGGDTGPPLWVREAVGSHRTAPDLGFRVIRELRG